MCPHRFLRDTWQASEMPPLPGSSANSPERVGQALIVPNAFENRQEAAGRAAMETGWSQRTVVVACNQFWVTLETSGVDRISFPLKRVELSFDDAQNRLRLEINR